MKTKKRTMKTKARLTLFGLVMVIGLCYANFANAESNSDSGGGPRSADARLDFRIDIPKFIYFRVGTAGGTIDRIDFNPTATEVATPLAITAGGAVTVDLISNGGNITINTAVSGGGSGISDGGGNFISFAQILSADTGNITAPTLADAGIAPVVIPSAGITVESDTWSYTYENPAIPPVPGIYNGQVTYTASIL